VCADAVVDVGQWGGNLENQVCELAA